MSNDDLHRLVYRRLRSNGVRQADIVWLALAVVPSYVRQALYRPTRNRFNPLMVAKRSQPEMTLI